MFHFISLKTTIIKLHELPCCYWAVVYWITLKECTNNQLNNLYSSKHLNLRKNKEAKEKSTYPVFYEVPILDCRKVS